MKVHAEKARDECCWQKCDRDHSENQKRFVVVVLIGLDEFHVLISKSLGPVEQFRTVGDAFLHSLLYPVYGNLFEGEPSLALECRKVEIFMVQQIAVDCEKLFLLLKHICYNLKLLRYSVDLEKQMPARMPFYLRGLQECQSNNMSRLGCNL